MRDEENINKCFQNRMESLSKSKDDDLPDSPPPSTGRIKKLKNNPYDFLLIRPLRTPYSLYDETIMSLRKLDLIISLLARRCTELCIAGLLGLLIDLALEGGASDKMGGLIKCVATICKSTSNGAHTLNISCP